jgi:hypothetical protein
MDATSTEAVKVASIVPILSSILIPLLAALFSLLGSLGGGFIVWLMTDRSEKYKKLYAPLRFHLMMMKLIVENREEVREDIQKWGDVATRINMIQVHMSPLTKKWIGHYEAIKELIEANAGLIKKKDFQLVSDFMDGFVKREITENGRNLLAERESRTSKLMDAVKALQDRLL